MRHPAPLVLCLSCLLFAATGVAQQQSDTASTQTVTLHSRDGDRIRCRLIALTASTVVVRPLIAGEEQLRVPIGHITQIHVDHKERTSSAEELDTSIPEEAEQPTHVLELSGGSRLRGDFLGIRDGCVLLRPTALDTEEELAIPLAGVRQLLTAGTLMKPADRGKHARVRSRGGDVLQGRITTTADGRLLVQGDGFEARLRTDAIAALYLPHSLDEDADAETDTDEKNSRALRIILRGGSSILADTLAMDGGRLQVDLLCGESTGVPLRWVTRIDLHVNLASNDYLHGNTLLAGGYKNTVVELDQAGNEIMTYQGNGTWSAEKMSNGNVLVANYTGNNVVEVDADGEEVWSYPDVRPLHARPLDNGNVLIADQGNNRAIEVDRRKKIVWKHQTDGQCNDAVRLPNGNTLLAYSNVVQEVDAKGEAVWEYRGSGQIYGIQKLGNGHVLVADFGGGAVYEVDAEGRKSWSYDIDQPSDAWRLDNGNTLITTSSQWLEVDPEGTIVWQKDGANYGTARK